MDLATSDRKDWIKRFVVLDTILFPLSITIPVLWCVPALGLEEVSPVFVGAQIGVLVERLLLHGNLLGRLQLLGLAKGIILSLKKEMTLEDEVNIGALFLGCQIKPSPVDGYKS